MDGKARRVEKGLSQETCLARYNRPLRRREKGSVISSPSFLSRPIRSDDEIGLILHSIREPTRSGPRVSGFVWRARPNGADSGGDFADGARRGTGAGGQGASGNPTAPRDEKSRRARPSVIEPRVAPKPPANPEPEVLSANNVSTASDSRIAVVSAIANSFETVGAAISGSTGNDAEWLRHWSGGTGSGNGPGSFGSRLWNWAAEWQRIRLAGKGSALIQARYRDTPKPVYPESARREGREGRVVLRVLVDDQGRSKSSRINRSSGSEALDRAATRR